VQLSDARISDPAYIKQNSGQRAVCLASHSLHESVSDYNLTLCTAVPSSVPALERVSSRLLYPMKTAFPSVYQLFAAAVTFGASSATCEASFSTLTRVLTAYRRSMTHDRKRNLVLLAFLRSYTKNVNMEAVLRCFSKNSRKLQLFWLGVV